MSRPYSLLLVAASLALCGGVEAQTPQAMPDPFAADTRLARPASLRVEGLPVTELLSLLSEKTGVGLSVEQDIGEEKVVVFNAARPLRDILLDLARLFHNAWERIEDKGLAPRYRLCRSTRSRAYEDGLAQNTTRRILAQLQAQVRALNESPERLAKRPETDPIRTNLSDPKTRLGTLLYGALSPSQQSTLLSRHVCFVRFSDLTPLDQTAVRNMFAGFIAENHAMIQGLQERHPGAIVGNHRLEQEDLNSDSIRFFVDGGVSSKMIAFSLTGDLMTAGAIATFDKSVRYLLPIHGNPYTGKTLGAHHSLPDPKAVAIAMREKEWLDKLHALAEASGIPVMADFYRAKGEEKLREDPATAIAPKDLADAVNVLDQLSGTHGSLWWTSGTTLLLRTRAWYETRRYEIPDRWLLDVSKHLQGQRGIPTYADVLRLLELTPEQMYGLQSGFYYEGGSESSFSSPAFEKELWATRSLLELLRDNASPRGNDVPVPTWEDLGKHGADKTLEQVILTYDTLTPRQRGLIPMYLQTQPHQYTPEQSTDFFALLYRPEKTIQVGTGGYKNVPIRVSGGFGTRLVEARHPLSELPNESNQVILTLPLSLPDDRRGNTRVEIGP